MEQLDNTALQLDSALETRLVSEAVAMIDPEHTAPWLHHSGAVGVTGNEILFAERTARHGALVLSVHMSNRARQGFEQAVQREQTYGQLTPELGAICLAAITKSRIPELELAAVDEPEQSPAPMMEAAPQAA